MSILILSFFALSRELKVTADFWMPFNGKPNSENEGFVVEILREIYEPKGYTVNYFIRPWSRAVMMGYKGEVDLIIGAVFEEAKGFYFPDEPIGLLSNDFYALKNSKWKYEGYDSFKNIRIGIIRDYSYGENLDRFIKANKNLFDANVGENALELNIKKLLLGRIDILIDTKAVVDLKLNEMNLNDTITYIGCDDTADSLFVAFSPLIDDSKTLIRIFDMGISEIRQSGRLKQILAKYGQKDWKKTQR